MKNDKLPFVLLFFYLVTKPLYLWDNIPFQISDITMLLTLCFTYLRISHEQVQQAKNSNNAKVFNGIFNTVTIVIIYQAIVNISFYFIIGSQTYERFSLLKNNLYYVFNCLAILLIVWMFQYWGEKTLSVFAKGIVCSMILTVLGIFASFGNTSRNQSFFNNPNQLGYYALLVFISTQILHKHYKNVEKVLLIASSLFCIIVSGSKAAIFGWAVEAAIMICAVLASSHELRFSRRAILSFFAFVFVIAFAHNYIIDILKPYIDSLTMRFESSSISTESLGESRGYDRIAEIGLNVLTGVGEGAFGRFSIMTGNETHSSFATIIVSYGVIGLLLYIILFWKFANRNRKSFFRLILTFSGTFVYWLSHNGLRNSLFWMLLIVFFITETGINPICQNNQNAQKT